MNVKSRNKSRGGRETLTGGIFWIQLNISTNGMSRLEYRWEMRGERESGEKEENERKEKRCKNKASIKREGTCEKFCILFFSYKKFSWIVFQRVSFFELWNVSQTKQHSILH